MKHYIRQRQLDRNGLMTTRIVMVNGELGSGILDKNGREIFEGDEIKIDGEKMAGRVTFSQLFSLRAFESSQLEVIDTRRIEL